MMITEITAVLVDDEQDSREVLTNQLKKFFPEIRIIGEASSAEEAYTTVSAKKPQLVFLDIQMPMGSGFSFLQRFAEIPFEVIFVTSFDQYAINAIKFSALDYLLKPVTVNDLKNSIQKAKKHIEQKKVNDLRVVNLLYNLNSEEKNKKVALHSGKNVEIVDISTIAFIKADGRYSEIVCLDSTKYVTSRTLKEFLEYLPSDSLFIRISQSLLINTTEIKSYTKGETCTVELKAGISFEVSRRKKQEILEKLKRLMNS